MTWYSSKSTIQKNKENRDHKSSQTIVAYAKLKISCFQISKNKLKVFLFKLLKSSISLTSLRVYYILDFLDPCTCKNFMIQEHWDTCKSLTIIYNFMDP